MKNLPRTEMEANAKRIVELANAFGNLPFNSYGQRIEATLNCSIPTARLIETGIVTAVADTADGVNEHAVAEVENYCREAIALLETNGSDFAAEWKAEGVKLGLYEPKLDEGIVEEIDWYSTEVQTVRIPGARRNVQSAVQAAWAARVRRQAKRFGVKVHVNIAASQDAAHVRVIEEARS